MGSKQHCLVKEVRRVVLPSYDSVMMCGCVGDWNNSNVTLTIVSSADRFLNKVDSIPRSNQDDDISIEESTDPVVVQPRERTTSTNSSKSIELLKKKKRLQMERQKQKEEVDARPPEILDDQKDKEPEGQRAEEEKQEQKEEEEKEAGKQQQQQQQPGENVRVDTTSRVASENIKQQEKKPKEEVADVPRKASTKSVRGESQERMAKLVEALRKKNKQLEHENIQLEEMISSLDTQVKKDEDDIAALNGSIKQLMKSKQDTEDRSALLQNALEEREGLVISQKSMIEKLEKQLRDKEKESATATAERSVSETHIIASLRKDVEAAETLLENERRAHAVSRKNFAAREQELDESVTRAAAALSESQEKIEHYSTKLAESQERCTMLEADIDALSRRLPESIDNATIDNGKASQQRMQELEADLASALREGATARNSVKSLEEDLSRIRAENLHLKQQMSNMQASDTIELKARVKELTDALYSKQSQIENLTAERGALQMQLDRQGSSTRSDGMRRRSAVVDKMFSGESYDNVVPMNALGPGYERLANAPGHLGGAVQAGAKLLDAIALQAVILIRQSPLWRLGVFAYILGMHALIYALLFFHQQVSMASPGNIVDPQAVHTSSTG